MNNILLVGAGRRNSLAELFIQNGFNIYSYEFDEVCPIQNVATILKGKKWTDKDIKNDISKYVDDLNIKLVIPLQDQAIPIVYGIKNAICSTFESSKICFDKILFEEFMLQNFPEIYPSPDSASKIIKKYRFGYGSNDIEILDNKNFITDENYVYQSLKVGDEYTVDAYFDKDSNFINACSRLRLRTAGGEVLDSLTKENKKLINFTKKVGEKLKLIGPTCFQYIVEKNNIFLFEINARFGGGSTLSIHSGLNMIEMLKKEYVENEKIYKKDYLVKYNILMRRAFRDFYYELN